MVEAWLAALGVEAALLALGLALFLPGQGRPPAPGAPSFLQRYGWHLAGFALVALAVAAFRVLQPFATPVAIVDAGHAVGDALQGMDEGLRAVFGMLAGPLADHAAAAVLLLLYPLVVVLAPVLWLAADEERAAKTCLTAYAVFLALSVPLHFLLIVQVPQARPFPFLPEVAALYFPSAHVNAIPGTHAGLALLAGLAARRSRNARFALLAFAVAPASLAALLYVGVNGLVGVLSGCLVAVFADILAERATSVERIAHQRVDATPERKMQIKRAAEELLFQLAWAAETRDLKGVEPKLVGSVAKDTYLAHKVDIDAFVLFPTDTPRRKLEEEGLALGRAVLQEPEERFAEHPYLAGKWKGIEAEVVPAYKVRTSAERMSAVDRTPFHTAYVLGKLEGLQRRDVRLLKQFLLGIGVYGAEAKVQGFSGYLAELLVLKYGSFRGVMERGADWRVGQLLALEPFEGAPRFPEPLILIDPVDPTRNVASAVSLEKLLLFQEAARAYLDEPRLSFFFPRPVVPLPPERLAAILRKRGHALVAVRLERPDILEDSLHAQLRKAGLALGEALERGGFKPLDGGTHATARAAVIVFEVESLAINEREVHAGPPVRSKEHAERFRAKWTGNDRALSAVYEEQGKLLVARRREFTNAAALLRAKALELDLGKDLSVVAHKRGFEVLADAEALRALEAAPLTMFLQRARPWER